MAIFAATTQQYFAISRINRDLRIKQTADRYARTVANIFGFDLRIVGNGIPFDQPDFQIGEDSANLTSPIASPEKKIQPIVLDTVNSNDITLRLSESGEMYVLAATFTPASALSVVLTDVSNLEVNDKIYISNGSVAGSDGFYGKISAVNTGTKTLTIDPTDYVSSVGATFSTGSSLVQVSEVRYYISGGTMYRTVDSGTPIALMPNASFSLRFLDYSGAAITLAGTAPRLSETQLTEELATIEVTVNVQGTGTLSEGNTYTAVVSQIFSLRNLNIIQSS